MDQNQTVDNDLQKAIDNITNTTNVDPVFSDPVAAPSSIPEGDTGELGEPVGPFPESNIEMAQPAPAQEPIAPFDPLNIPELNVPEVAPTPVAPVPEETPAPTTFNGAANLNTRQIKEAALRDLIPLLDRINMPPSKKFNICRNVFEDLRDYAVLEQAYRAATEIPNETERAEALLYIVEAIDKM